MNPKRQEESVNSRPGEHQAQTSSTLKGELPLAAPKALELAEMEILQKLTEPHIKSRTQAPDHYPSRDACKDVTSFDDPNYKPVFYAQPEIYGDPENLPGWAAPLPQDPDELRAYLDSLDKNPGGPTGIEGPGELGQPVNWAADPVVITIDPSTGEIYQIQVLRDIGVWAIPGGMVDSNETHLNAALRELMEETGVELDDVKEVEIYQGYVDDFRNTDTHYMCTTAFLFTIPWEQAQKMKFATHDQSEGIQDRCLRKLDQENVAELFASHPEIVKLGLIKISSQIEQNVDGEEAQKKVTEQVFSILGISGEATVH